MRIYWQKPFWEGFELTTPRIDTVELSQIFYPTLERYNLGALAAELEIELHHAHSRSSGCYGNSPAAVEIERENCELAKRIDRKLLSMAECLIYESRLLIEDALEDSSLFYQLI